VSMVTRRMFNPLPTCPGVGDGIVRPEPEQAPRATARTTTERQLTGSPPGSVCRTAGAVDQVFGCTAPPFSVVAK
jgi:hypothetical protein